MAYGFGIDDELLDSLPEGGATVLRTEVVGPQETEFRSRKRSDNGNYTVPTVGSGDFESTGPFVREGDGVASRIRANPSLTGGFPSVRQDDPDGMKAGMTYLRRIMNAQKMFQLLLRR